MKLIMIECTAEELKANRTILDNISEAISAFSESFCGMDGASFARAMAAGEEGKEVEDETFSCAIQRLKQLKEQE